MKFASMLSRLRNTQGGGMRSTAVSDTYRVSRSCECPVLD